MRTLLESFLECAVPFLHFGGDGAVLTESPEATALLQRTAGGFVDRLSTLARNHAAAGPTLAQPNEFAVPFTAGLLLRVTAFPVRSGAGEINLIAVLALTSSAVVLPESAINPGRAYSAAEQWYDDRQLTAREREIATHVATGQPSPLIAERLGISVHTVRRHTERVFTKLGVSSRAELARRIGGISNDINKSLNDQ